MKSNCYLMLAAVLFLGGIGSIANGEITQGVLLFGNTVFITLWRIYADLWQWAKDNAKKTTEDAYIMGCEHGSSMQAIYDALPYEQAYDAHERIQEKREAEGKRRIEFHHHTIV